MLVGLHSREMQHACPFHLSAACANQNAMTITRSQHTDLSGRTRCDRVGYTKIVQLRVLQQSEILSGSIATIVRGTLCAPILHALLLVPRASAKFVYSNKWYIVLQSRKSCLRRVNASPDVALMMIGAGPIENVEFRNAFANVQNACHKGRYRDLSAIDYEAFAAELNCLSEAKDDVIAEYAEAAFEFVDEVEDVLFERA